MLYDYSEIGRRLPAEHKQQQMGVRWDGGERRRAVSPPRRLLELAGRRAALLARRPGPQPAQLAESIKPAKTQPSLLRRRDSPEFILIHA